MNQHISIPIATPHVTIERYSKLTGLYVETINGMLADSRLIRHLLRKDKKLEKVIINISAMTLDALSNSNTSFA
ncbi:regulator [Pseudescherichia sp.]|uniref:regulator n=1 Tax=Pseudescherichia sp. TaxID=2055881 RepID=UPI0028A99530|nr:regulator [Pseudescherichia sp.]